MDVTPEQAAAELKRRRSQNLAPTPAQAAAELEKRRAAAPVIQEMHPDFTDADRLVVQNFTNNNEASVNYLQKRHPNLEIRVDDKSGQIQARSRTGVEPYRVLDPSLDMPSTGSVWGDIKQAGKEGLRDVGDIGYDVASGLGSGLATAAGGLVGAAGGTVLGGPVGAAGGALGGGSLAGGTASGGLEYLRQKLGNMFGVDQNTDAAQVAGATLGGAASPFLFGTGGTVGSALGKKILGEGLDEGAKLGLQKAQRGAIGYGFDNVVKPAAAKLGGLLSGTGEAVGTLVKNPEKVNALIKDPEGALNYIDETGDVIDKKFRAAKNKKYEEFQTAVGAAGDAETVDVTGVRDRFKAAIAEAEKDVKAGKGTEASKELVADLKDAYQRYFTFDDVAKVPAASMKPTGLLDAAGKPLMAPVTEVVEQPVKKELEKLSPKAALELNAQLGEMADFKSINPQAVSGSRMKPSQSRAEKRIMTLGADLKSALDDQINTVLPENALPAKKAYGELANLERGVNKLTQNPRQAFANLRNADVQSNLTNKQFFHKVDRLVGTDLGERAKVAQAVEAFGPGRESFLGGGLVRRVPAALIGGAAGAALDRQYGNGSGAVGGPAGLLAGGLLGGPAMMRKYVNMGLGVGAANQALGPLRVGLGGKLLEDQISPWLGVKP